MLKDLFTLFLVSVFFTTIGYTHPQQKEDKKQTEQTIRPWSLQFGISNNLTLSSFGGRLITAKKHYTNAKAVRFGLILDGRISTINTKHNQINNEVSTDYTTSGGNKSFDIFFDVILLKYLRNKNGITPYWGAGPNLQFRFNQSDSERQNTDYTGESRAWRGAIGIEALCGIEWSVSTNISIFAEYSLGALFQYTKTNQATNSSGYKQVQRTVRKEFIINRSSISRPVPRRSNGTVSTPNTVRFGLSAYF